MSAWTELPRPATPGPWGAHIANEPIGVPGLYRYPIEVTAESDLNGQDAAAIAALPEIREEVERLRAWVDRAVAFDIEDEDVERDELLARIRAGEWPEGRRS